jgi:hypothetical protein
MGKAVNKRGERALGDLVDILDQVREGLVRRLDDIDLDAMRKRGTRAAGVVRSDLRRRVRPRRRRLGPGAIAGIAGLAVLGLAAAGAGYLVYDRERREVARRRLGEIQSRARDRYTELTSGLTGRARSENGLQQLVEQTIGEGGKAPTGLDVVVEGRTVYLRGAVSDPAFVDAAAERVHAVPGVVAVVNLTTSAADERARASIK